VGGRDNMNHPNSSLFSMAERLARLTTERATRDRLPAPVLFFKFFWVVFWAVLIQKTLFHHLGLYLPVN
jgi:hypothetical protein